MNHTKMKMFLTLMVGLSCSTREASALKTSGSRANDLIGFVGDPINMLELQWGSPYSKVEGTRDSDGSLLFTLSDAVEGVVTQRRPSDIFAGNQCEAVDMKIIAPETSRMLSIVEVQNADDCQQLCRGALDCRAAVFNSSASSCELFKSVKEFTNSQGSTVVLPTCDHDCFKKGQTYTGTQTSLGFAPNANMCQVLCASSFGCHAFTWNSKTQECFAFPEDKDLKEDSNAVSGTKASCHERTSLIEYQGVCEIDELSGSKFGNVSEQQNVDSYEACRKLCLNNAACKWLTYNSRTRICYLKSGKGVLEHIKKGDSTGPRYCDGKCFLQGIKLTGTPIQTIPNTLSAHLCHFECWNSSVCGLWSFDEASKNCYLYEHSPSTQGRRCAHFITGGKGPCGVDALYNIPSKSCAVRGVRYGGQPLFVTSAATAEACQLKCQVTSACEAWALDILLEKCAFFLADAESKKQFSLNFISGPRWCQPRCVKVNKEGSGKVIQNFPAGFATPEECQLRCQATQGCTYFSFYGHSGACKLFSSNSSRRTTGVTSGDKYCEGS